MTTWSELRRGAVLFEDEAALVLAKPPGIAVMGERHGTDLVRLAEEAGETLFPAHRIDKNTSGAILFAKRLEFHGDLTRQFNKRTVDKAYLAVTASTGLPERGRITLPFSVGRKNRVRVAGNRSDIGFDAQRSRWSLAPGTEFGHVRTYPSDTGFARAWHDDRHTLLVVVPHTGRRHQIRVHLAWIGHPILGDPLFDKNAEAAGLRTFLHSWRLAFDAAWAGGARVEVLAPPGPDFWQPVTPPPSDELLDRTYHRLREDDAQVDVPDDDATDDALSDDIRPGDLRPGDGAPRRTGGRRRPPHRHRGRSGSS
ncbi:RluA family pseudouridine synthase [Saccharothrix sp. S26]|uniref:RluA family pseudouridine synthase n=1 Tax=Saccharothrix sp. S26 TaxID=2907215 RepID=UPI001F3E0A11|nr:RluA family pseudouridine synthase [Saccharothrix sp. S26]MCE6995236.1 RluA family pseudouridine synthase [Saccharothrix sp. S26]